MAWPLAVVIGGIGKLPLAGLSLYYLHYIVGLQALGYDVHYVERQNTPDDCYDPRLGAMTSDPDYALHYLETVLPSFGITRQRFSFVDRGDVCHGSGWKSLHTALDRADFVLTVADPTWFPELERCGRRAFVDGDPLFTQVAMATGEGSRAVAPTHYDVLFTYGVRIGKPDCALPSAGRTWLPTRPVVATKLWKATPTVGALPVSVLMHWAAGSDVTYAGQVYGHKDREFERFIDLPQRTPQALVLAVGGRKAPRDRVRAHGWTLVDPLVATRTIKAYQAFVSASKADLGIAKHAYVASRCGWFSDRSTCFLAAGRPVLHQDTACGDWLPTGEGVLLFSTL